MTARRIVIIDGTQAGPTAAARAREIDEDDGVDDIIGFDQLIYAVTSRHGAGRLGVQPRVDAERALKKRASS